jgi:hypothetical protein
MHAFKQLMPVRLFSFFSGSLVLCFVSVLPARGIPLQFLMSGDSATIHLQQRMLKMPELLSAGNFDVLHTGQVSASARIFRIHIGEPGRLAIPLSVFSGVSSDPAPAAASGPVMPGSYDPLVMNLINPLSGLLNVASEGICFPPKARDRLTRFGWVYHVGIRLLSGIQARASVGPSAIRPLPLLNRVAAVGMYVQTGAWDRANIRNMGRFWLSGRYILCKSRSEQVRLIIPDAPPGWFSGWALAAGIDITRLVLFRVVLYRYTQGPDPDFKDSICQFSFTYSL